jgi:hypothetical protein
MLWHQVVSDVLNNHITVIFSVSQRSAVWVDWAYYKDTDAEGSESVGSEPMGEVEADNEATRVQSALHKTGILKATLTHVFCATEQASMCLYTK